MAEARVKTGGTRALMAATARILQNPGGMQAAVVALSQLQPEFRRREFAQRAVDLFEPVVIPRPDIMVFLPDSLDIVLLGPCLPRDMIRQVVSRVRGLFGADPLTRAQSSDQDHFARWFDLSREEHRKALTSLIDAVDQRSGEVTQRRGSWNVNDQPLTPQRLSLLLADMEHLDITPMLESQHAVRVGGQRTADVVFEEFFISLERLRQKIAPEINLWVDRWLFQDFSRSLDRHILRVLQEVLARREHPPPLLSVNMNLDSVASDAFDAFAAALAPGQTLIVEAQGADVFADVGAFLKIRDRLHERGHRILIDALTPRVLESVDLVPLGADYIKLAWNPGMAHAVAEEDAAAARALIAALGSDKVICCHVDSKEAMAWGLKAGLRCFQGFFIDTLVGDTAPLPARGGGGGGARAGAGTGPGQGSAPSPGLSTASGAAARALP